MIQQRSKCNIDHEKKTIFVEMHLIFIRPPINEFGKITVSLDWILLHDWLSSFETVSTVNHFLVQSTQYLLSTNYLYSIKEKQNREDAAM